MDSLKDIDKTYYMYQGTVNVLEAVHSEVVQDANCEPLQQIKAKIADFLCMKNVNFLFGSGTSSGAIPTMSGLMQEIESEIQLLEDEKDNNKKELFQKIKNKSGNNIEEILGVLYCKENYLAGVGDTDSSEYITCHSLISIIEDNIKKAVSAKPNGKVLDIYKNFYQKISVRNKDLARLNVFTTNNDLFNEVALDELNIHYIDGFTGGLKRYFNPSVFNCTLSKKMDTSIERFEPLENMVYLYKIHGSVNWVEDSNSNSYFTIRSLPTCADKGAAALIYPTPLKQNKSLGSPYVDLFREFQHKLLEPNSVLFVIGYSFSDEHVNDVIYRALATNTTFNLVIINYLSEDKPICKINDNRVFRIYSELKDGEGEGAPIHYFSRIVEELLPTLDYHAEERNSLDELTNFIKNNLKNKS